MKLQDPGLEALLEAYRADRRPTAAVRERMWQRFDRTRRPRRPWVRAAAAAAVAIAALLLLWVATRQLAGQATHSRGPASGVEAPYGREAPQPGGTAVTPGGRAAASERAPQAPVVEPPAAVPPPPSAGEARGKRSPSPGPRTPASSPKAPIDDLLLIEAAEAALGSDDPTRALELLRRHEQQFPSAPSAEERQALRVLALCAAGRAVEGRGARWAFLRDHPRSAYRERIEAACPGG